MNQGQTIAGEFFKSLGCESVMVRDINELFGQVKAVRAGKNILVRVQFKPEWGLNIATSLGTNWANPRYPFASIQYALPSAEEGPDNHTHYLLVAADNKRAVLAPRAVIDAANKAWGKVELNGNDVPVEVATVPNWTEGCSFCIRNDEGKWVKDPSNVWVKPVPVPMDPKAFLASL